MKRLFNFFSVTWLFIGFIGLAVSFYVLVGDSYNFWASGVAKQAKVVKLDHVNVHLRGLKTYYYQLDIDGVDSVHAFSFKLSKGHYYDVLSIDNGKEIILGNKDSSLFDIIVSQLGEPATYLLLAVCSYLFFTFIRYIKRHFTSSNPYD